MFKLSTNRMVAIVTNQLSLHTAAECAGLIGGSVRLTMHASG